MKIGNQKIEDRTRYQCSGTPTCTRQLGKHTALREETREEKKKKRERQY